MKDREGSDKDGQEQRGRSQKGSYPHLNTTGKQQKTNEQILKNKLMNKFS